MSFVYARKGAFALRGFLRTLRLHGTLSAAPGEPDERSFVLNAVERSRTSLAELAPTADVYQSSTSQLGDPGGAGR